jgi:hypothetical protein
MGQLRIIQIVDIAGGRPYVKLLLVLILTI